MQRAYILMHVQSIVWRKPTRLLCTQHLALSAWHNAVEDACHVLLQLDDRFNMRAICLLMPSCAAIHNDAHELTHLV